MATNNVMEHPAEAGSLAEAPSKAGDKSPGIPPFPAEYRASGLLLHIASLPSPYGIGDLGPTALDWVDRLQAAGQTWWQAQPLGPSGYPNSPCPSYSSFAANPALVSPDVLIADGLLEPGDCEGCAFPASHVDYAQVIPFKQRLLDAAWTKYKAGARRDLTDEFQQFCQEQEHWLPDYALFCALKTTFSGAHYLEWPADLIRREAAAMDSARLELADLVDQTSFQQFLLFRQARALKEYAAARGVRLIADLPFFVPPDSSDVWANPENFILDENRLPSFLAGTPPDCCSSLGQVWGNPVYNWEAMREGAYRWSAGRFRTALAHADVLRLNHFRGFAAAWHVPSGAPSARCGRWIPGPGSALFMAAEEEFGAMPFIAEDLGMVTADVSKLLHQLETPGTRVLQFAFDGHSGNPHLPANYHFNSVVYTSTLDQPTARAWYGTLGANERQHLWRTLRKSSGEPAETSPSLMKLAWSSSAALAMAPVQDLLNLAADARMSTPAGDWRWRLTPDMLRSPAFDWLSQLTKAAKRQGTLPKSQPRETA